jgi:hypothetical protein
MAYTLLFLKALGLTVSIECIVAAALQQWGGPRFRFDPKMLRLLAVVASASVLTLPYVWFVMPELIKSRIAYEWISEIGVALIEGFFYMLAFRISPKKAFVLSVFANAGSVLVGKVFF